MSLVSSHSMSFVVLLVIIIIIIIIIPCSSSSSSSPSPSSFYSSSSSHPHHLIHQHYQPSSTIYHRQPSYHHMPSLLNACRSVATLRCTAKSRKSRPPRRSRKNVAPLGPVAPVPTPTASFRREPGSWEEVLQQMAPEARISSTGGFFWSNFWFLPRLMGRWSNLTNAHFV